MRRAAVLKAAASDSTTLAHRLRAYVEKAPQSSVFEDAETGPLRRMHQGAANETTWFRITLADGSTYTVEVARSV